MLPRFFYAWMHHLKIYQPSQKTLWFSMELLFQFFSQLLLFSPEDLLQPDSVYVN